VIGSIINISSVNARLPPPMVDYAAAKAALTNLGTSLAEELGPRGDYLLGGGRAKQIQGHVNNRRRGCRAAGATPTCAPAACSRA
jgi:hypothetical protein